MDGDVLMGLCLINAGMNLLIVYLVAPIFNLKGKVCMLRDNLIGLEKRLLSIEERI